MNRYWNFFSHLICTDSKPDRNSNKHTSRTRRAEKFNRARLTTEKFRKLHATPNARSLWTIVKAAAKSLSRFNEVWKFSIKQINSFRAQLQIFLFIMFTMFFRGIIANDSMYLWSQKGDKRSELGISEDWVTWWIRAYLVTFLFRQKREFTFSNCSDSGS